MVLFFYPVRVIKLDNSNIDIIKLPYFDYLIGRQSEETEELGIYCNNVLLLPSYTYFTSLYLSYLLILL